MKLVVIGSNALALSYYLKDLGHQVWTIPDNDHIEPDNWYLGFLGYHCDALYTTDLEGTKVQKLADLVNQLGKPLYFLPQVPTTTDTKQ